MRSSFTVVAHKRHTRSFVVRAAVVDTDSWDLAHRKVVEQASADIPVVDADSDVDSCWVDRAVVQVIVDKLAHQDQYKVDQEVEGSFLALDLTLAVDNWYFVAMLAV